MPQNNVEIRFWALGRELQTIKEGEIYLKVSKF